jgi:hypothetical protein
MGASNEQRVRCIFECTCHLLDAVYAIADKYKMSNTQEKGSSRHGKTITDQNANPYVLGDAPHEDIHCHPDVKYLQ